MASGKPSTLLIDDVDVLPSSSTEPTCGMILLSEYLHYATDSERFPSVNVLLDRRMPEPPPSPSPSQCQSSVMPVMSCPIVPVTPYLFTRPEQPITVLVLKYTLQGRTLHTGLLFAGNTSGEGKDTANRTIRTVAVHCQRRLGCEQSKQPEA